MMYSFPDLKPVCCSMSSSSCCLLTSIQISQEAGQVVWYSHLLKNFPQFVVIHTIKGFGIVNKAEDVFLELSCFFDEPTNVGNLISGSSSFSKFSLNIWKFTVHILFKPCLDNFENYFAGVWDECNCAVVWTFFGITEHGPTHQSKTRIPPQPVPPVRKLPQASYPLSSEGRQNENHNHRKLT